MRVYNYKDGKAVFVNNERTFISENVAKVIEIGINYPDNLQADAGVTTPDFVRHKDEDILKMAELVEVEHFVIPEKQTDITFFLYKGKVLKISGKIGPYTETKLSCFNLEDLYEQLKTGNYK
ncbi:hypothetical protein [Parabacteroides sp. AM08-6]|uniref:hypothetical protein n=1 Tax=Parabacteroides sp. AM08-6 TaxID=2292053 RepID=UPI000EFF9525|nr:hypothetical protein [Parabacteroides sp. AM08-6]RHJ76134.1 hypothetical protein DW103_17265 [Parabacteroides sp. AM08-6]